MRKAINDEYKYVIQIPVAFNILFCIILLIVACVVDGYTSSVNPTPAQIDAFSDIAPWFLLF